MKEERIKVLALLPMELPKEIELDNTLEAMQNFVGGLIESISEKHQQLIFWQRDNVFYFLLISFHKFLRNILLRNRLQIIAIL